MIRPKWIVNLLEQGYVAHSQVKSLENVKTLSILESLNLVRIETNKSRRKIVVKDKGQFLLWVEANYPLSMISTVGLKTRSQNIAYQRNSKSGKTTHDVQPVIFKWFDSDPKSRWAKLTKNNGIVGITSNRLKKCNLSSEWCLLTVENWESFYTLEYPDIDTAIMAVYLSGNISDVTLRSLSLINPNPKFVLHFGDYDWVGLTIFQRIQSIFSEASLYTPENIEVLFQTYGQRKLVEQQSVPSSFNLKNEQCKKVIELIQQYNVGLEQEIVEFPSLFDFKIANNTAIPVMENRETKFTEI